MGLKALLKKILRKKQEEAIESAATTFQAESQALQSAPKRLAKDFDAFELGLAAGYTGRSLREIERSLLRIESQMVTKDWFKTEFEDKTPQLLEILKVVRQALEKHEAAMQKRFESIQSALEKLTGVAKRAPKPIRREILKEVQAIKRQVPLSQKMQRLLAIVKESGEISYDELGAKLGITTSALRGLLSNTLKRTNKLKRYTRERKGWVKYVEAL